ncbi:MAG: hypothetical protein ACI89X_002743 [Planctomycetota bacterium]|jgi:hypothetical protein
MQAHARAPPDVDSGIEMQTPVRHEHTMALLPAGAVTLAAHYTARTFVYCVDAASQQEPVELRAPRPERIAFLVFFLGGG